MPASMHSSAAYVADATSTTLLVFSSGPRVAHRATPCSGRVPGRASGPRQAAAAHLRRLSRPWVNTAMNAVTVR
eukprot:3895611-Pyramimonas_sp.AAC.1